jgi:hypothetical protein
VPEPRDRATGEPASETDAVTVAGNRAVPGSRVATGVYCVVGAHRSGTSLVANLLQRAGVSMGSRLLGPQPDNPHGFFEDVDFFGFHEDCLRRRGWTYIDPQQTRVAFDDEETRRARALVAARAELAAWGWKDPRTCLFLHAWHELIPACRYVVTVRHPLAVLASLLRRGERTVLADVAAGLAMVASYNRALLDFLDDVSPPAVVIETGAVFDAPHRVSAALAGVGITLPSAAIAAVARPEDFRRLDRHAGIAELEPLVDAIDPRPLELHRRLGARLDARAAVDAPDDDTIDALRRLGSLADRSPAGDAGYLRHALLLSGLCLVDPSLRLALGEHQGRLLETAGELHDSEMRGFVAREELQQTLNREREHSKANHERAVAAETSARENYERALAAERSAAENHARAESAETAARENHERAESAEAASRENYARAESAETAARENHERAQSAEAASRENYRRAVAAEANAKRHHAVAEAHHARLLAADA